MNDIKIDLGAYYDPMQLLKFFKDAGINSYNYAFIDNHGRIIKYGIQYSVHGNQPGERVYRQAANLDGWHKEFPYSDNGVSMQRVSKDYAKFYGVPLDRSNVSILVWDQTNANYSGSEMRARCQRIETSLIENHIDVFGYAPPGNNEKSTKSKVMKKKNSAIIDEIFS